MRKKTPWIRRKLLSKRGASITFALLLFLVCAVIGSVVLTAGTAAAGRFSKIAEYDQRYYSVTSAAGLLADEMNETTVDVQRTKKTVTTTVVTTTAVEGALPSVSRNTSTTGPDYDEVNKAAASVMEKASRSLVLGEGATRDASWYANTINLGSAVESGYDLTLSFAGLESPYDASVNPVSITGRLDPGTRTLSFVIIQDQYAVRLIMKASFSSVSNTENETSTSSSSSGNTSTNTTTETVTVTKTTTVKWTLLDVETIGR